MPKKTQLLPVYLVLVGLVACSDSSGLPDPTVPNTEIVQNLYALTGTPVNTPSAYSISGNRRVRTDTTTNFDFAYNIERDGRRVFIPQAALGIDTSNSVKPGLQRRNDSFDAIKVAPSNGYITDEVVPIAVGERYALRGRVSCSIGVPKYAKMEIVSFDDAAGIVTFRILSNDNCGFRGLE